MRAKKVIRSPLITLISQRMFPSSDVFPHMCSRFFYKASFYSLTSSHQEDTIKRVMFALVLFVDKVPIKVIQTKELYLI
jgi:hypothetical protein